MIRAKVFKSGNSQAIRLPKDYRVDTEEVFLNKVGNVMVLIPTNDPWANFKEGIKEAEDFPKIDNSKLKNKKIEL